MLTGWSSVDRWPNHLREFDRTLRAFERVFDADVFPEVFRIRERERALASWPRVNAFETKEAFVYRAEVPGLADGDVSVFVEDESLTLRGERKAEVPDGYKVHLRERAPVAFTRKLALPGPVDADAVTAKLKDGVLTVTLPKAKETLPRQIAVTAG